MAVLRHDYAQDHLAHAVDGHVTTDINPAYPIDRQGTDPDGLNRHLRDLGIDPAADDSIDNPIPIALALATRITGVLITPDDLRRPGPWRRRTRRSSLTSAMPSGRTPMALEDLPGPGASGQGPVGWPSTARSGTRDRPLASALDLLPLTWAYADGGAIIPTPALYRRLLGELLRAFFPVTAVVGELRTALARGRRRGLRGRVIVVGGQDRVYGDGERRQVAGGRRG